MNNLKITKTKILNDLKPYLYLIFTCIKYAFDDYEKYCVQFSHTLDKTTKKNILFNTITYNIRSNIHNFPNMTYIHKSDRTFLLVINFKYYNIYIKFKSIKDGSFLPSNIITHQTRSFHEQSFDFEKPCVGLIAGYTMDHIGMLKKVYVTYSMSLRKVEWYYEIDAKTQNIKSTMQEDIEEINELTIKPRVISKIKKFNTI